MTVADWWGVTADRECSVIYEVDDDGFFGS